MNNFFQGAGEATECSRRSFLKIGATGMASLGTGALIEGAKAAAGTRTDETAALPAYLTPPKQFRTFVRENPPVDQFTPEQRRQAGLDRETWRCEILADPAGKSTVERPFAQNAGTALTWARLMELAETHAVRFLHVLTCTNVADPFGMGLWEGVPLRELVWLAGPSANTRRIYYWGYHNDDPKQRFVSSLPIGRVLEDPPGELPVILCYKLNGQWLAPKNGGPARLFVPGAYGNKAVKWLQQIRLTNAYQANDTYAEWNNDVENPMKTQARFLSLPKTVKTGQTVMLAGAAQVGISGLSRVQYSVQPTATPRASDDPHGRKLPWQEARILPPPTEWGGGLPDGKLPPIPLQFDPATGQPRSWPLRYTLAYWTAVLPPLGPGEYRLCCRSIDANGVAQPLPRPFPRSGKNELHEITVQVLPS